MRQKSQNENSRAGLGIIEVLIAALVLAAIVATTFAIFTGSRKRSINLSSKTDCTSLTNAITNQIRSYDNSMTIRNWMVTSSTNFAQFMPAQDPFCNNTGGRIAVCDPFPLYSLQGAYVNLDDLRTYLNLRGAFAWASSLYNSKGSQICSMNGTNPGGISLKPEQMGAILPGMADLPTWADHFNLYIQEATTPCGTPATSKNSKFSIRVTTHYEAKGAPAGQLQACFSDLAVASATESNKPTVQITRVYNGMGIDIPNGYCSDTRLAPAAPDARYRQINFDYGINEPGSLLLSRKDSPPPEKTPPDSFYNAPDMPLPAAVGSIIPAPGTISYNQPVSGTLTFTNVQDRQALDKFPDSMYGFSFAAADTSGNLSTMTPSRSFMVHTPTCKYNPSLYCPGASHASPDDATCASCDGPPNPNCNECWDTQGDKNRRPYDNCMNGLCPDGQRPPVCDDTLKPLVCKGTNYSDDCGLNRCPGEMDVYCPPAPYTTVPCGDNVPGQCIASCGKGAGINVTGLNIADYDCNRVVTDKCGNDTGLRGIGGNNGRIECPPPPPGSLGSHKPGCDCSGIDNNNIGCGRAVDDVCINPADVTPESCGLGQNGCSPCAPNPPVASAGCTDAPVSGFWECKDHQWAGDTTCNSGTDIHYPNPTCRTYTLTVTPTGHRHDGSSLRYRVLWNGPYYGISVTDDAIGKNTPKHGGNPTNPLDPLAGLPPITRVYSAVPGVPIFLRLSIYDIHDSSLRLDWTITPSSP